MKSIITILLAMSLVSACGKNDAEFDKFGGEWALDVEEYNAPYRGDAGYIDSDFTLEVNRDRTFVVSGSQYGSDYEVRGDKWRVQDGVLLMFTDDGEEWRATESDERLRIIPGRRSTESYLMLRP